MIFAFFIYITFSKQEQENTKKGIIFSKEIGVWTDKQSKQCENGNLFYLHEGTKFEITDELEGWSKILISNGSEGWIESNSIKVLN